MTSQFQQVRSISPLLAIIADDLTGACDSAAAFGARGIRSLVITGEEFPAAFDAEVIALSTDTRDISQDKLQEELYRHLGLLAERNLHTRIFKKIDSALRGNTFAEIALLSSFLPSKILVIAPAFPAMGRRTKYGIQHIGNRAVQQSVDIEKSLRAAGVVAQRFDNVLSITDLRAAVGDGIKAGRRELLFDIETQPDLQAVVTALAPFEDEVLWVGSGGLAQALARDLPSNASPVPVEAQIPVEPQRGKTIFFVGSNHPVTEAQIEQLRRDHEVVECTPADGCPDAPVIICRAERGSDEGQTAAFFCGIEPSSIGCIFVTGGDTASHLCHALGVTAISVHYEFACGVPVGTLCGGSLNGVSVITKSGGFGQDDLLSRVATTYTNEAGVIQ